MLKKELINVCDILIKIKFFIFVNIIIINKKLCPTQIQGFLMKRIFLMFLMFFMFSYAHAGLFNFNFQEYKVTCVLEVYNDKDVEKRVVRLDISTSHNSIYHIECKELGIDFNMIEDIPALIGPYQKQYETTDNDSFAGVLIAIKNSSYGVCYLRPKGIENVNPSIVIQYLNSSYDVKAKLIPVKVSWFNKETNEWENVQVTSSVTYEDDLIYQFLYKTGSK